MATQRYVFLVRSNEDLPRHQMAEACLTAGRQLAAPWRYQMFQDPCTSQRQSHMRPGTMVASSGVHTQPRTAHMMHQGPLVIMKYTVPVHYRILANCEIKLKLIPDGM